MYIRFWPTLFVQHVTEMLLAPVFATVSTCFISFVFAASSLASPAFL